MNKKLIKSIINEALDKIEETVDDYLRKTETPDWTPITAGFPEVGREAVVEFLCPESNKTFRAVKTWDGKVFQPLGRHQAAFPVRWKYV